MVDTVAVGFPVVIPGGYAALSGTQTFDGDKTFSGTTTLSGATTVSGVATFSAAAVFSTMFKMPSATVAAAGSVQGDAAQIATGFTLVSAADGTKGVLLPAAAAGLVCFIKNNVAAALKIWPSTGDGINAVAVNSAFSITNLTSVTLIAYDATTWYSIPLVAS